MTASAASWWVEAVVLGLVQGLTEFLPISSSAHVRIVAALAGWGDPGAAFTAVTQIGTEVAVLAYFRRDIAAIVLAWGRSIGDRRARAEPEARIGWLVIVGTVPIVVLGLLFRDQIASVFRDLRLVGLTLIVFGVLLGVADRIGAKRRAIAALTVRDGVLYGLAQSLALIPGVSRSGGTITAGLFLGYTRAAATRYAFLLAVPAVLGAGVFELRDVGGSATAWGPTILATGIAFAAGYAVIAWLMRYLATHGYWPFVVYRVALGAAVLALVFAGVLEPMAGPSAA